MDGNRQADLSGIVDFSGPAPMTLETIKEECMDATDGALPGMASGSVKEKGTFWPEKPKVDAAAVKASTVLTNLQRGNIPTILQTVVEPVVQSLHQGAGQGELRASELKDKSGKIVDERDHALKTPLMWAAAYGQTPTVNLLLRSGADVNAEARESETALHLAASNGHHDVVRVLLNFGAKVDSLDENSCTPLMFAAMGNHPHSVNELLSHGADITLTNIASQTALTLAVREKASMAQTVLENYVAGLIKGIIDTRNLKEVASSPE